MKKGCEIKKSINLCQELPLFEGEKKRCGDEHFVVVKQRARLSDSAFLQTSAGYNFNYC